MNTDRAKRAKRTVSVTVLFAMVILVYLAVYGNWHIGIPCLFNTVTGLKCPGCGITRGTLALLRLDLKAAMQLNALILPILIYIAGIYLHSAYQYIRTGKHRISFPVKYADTVFLIMLAAWWILRNVLKL